MVAKSNTLVSYMAFTLAEVFIALIGDLKQTFCFRDDSVSHRQERVRENKMFAFTLAEVLYSKKLYLCAFTLAEVLIVLGIIGLIADMTIPTLMHSYQKTVTISQFQKAYSTLNQAVKLSEIENGPSTEWAFAQNQSEVEKYFETYYKPYLKVLKICKTYQDCGYKKGTWKYFNGTNGKSTMIVSPTARTTAVLSDGAIAILGGYTEYLGSDGTYKRAPLDIYYDLNGSKEPNTYGKDVFLFSYTPKGIMPYGYNSTDNQISNICKNFGDTCGTKIIRDGYKINYW